MQPESDGAEPDFYWEGNVVVFTAGYHLRRGFCCQQGCRHCPYKEGFSANAPIRLVPMSDGKSAESA